MTKQERQAAMLAILQEKGELHVQTLCRKFHIVAMTVRRDLMELEKRGEIIRTHGGAIAKEKKVFDVETPLAKRLKSKTEEKQQVAACAKSFLQANDRIFVASGSTIDIFAQSLFHSLPLTVVTDALNVALHLSQDAMIQLYMLGGEVRSNALTLTGAIAQNNLRQFRLQKAFISVNGIDEQGNLYTSSVVESTLLEVLFERVETVYVLADSSKFGKKDLVAIHNPKSYHLITTKQAALSILEHYQKLGIVITYAM